MAQRMLLVEGIATSLRNVDLASALGQIPFTECFPELWVVEDSQAPRALELLRAFLQPPAALDEGWTCPRCHAQIDGGLMVCWNCETAREEGGGKP
jgi:hypothetical protein